MTATQDPTDTPTPADHRLLAAVEATIAQLDRLADVYAAAVEASNVRDVALLTGQGRTTVSRWSRGDMPAKHVLTEVSAQMRNRGCA